MNSTHQLHHWLAERACARVVFEDSFTTRVHPMILNRISRSTLDGTDAALIDELTPVDALASVCVDLLMESLGWKGTRYSLGPPLYNVSIAIYDDGDEYGR